METFWNVSKYWKLRLRLYCFCYAVSCRCAGLSSARAYCYFKVDTIRKRAWYTLISEEENNERKTYSKILLSPVCHVHVQCYRIEYILIRVCTVSNINTYACNSLNLLWLFHTIILNVHTSLIYIYISIVKKIKTLMFSSPKKSFLHTPQALDRPLFLL